MRSFNFKGFRAFYEKYSEEDLLNKRKEKLEERGGFKEGIILKRVY